MGAVIDTVGGVSSFDVFKDGSSFASDPPGGG
jgi:hypothetical protein